WTAGWSLLALHYLGSAFAGGPGESSLQISLDQWLFGVAAVLFFLGAQLYAQKKPWLLAGIIVGVVLAGGSAANHFFRFPISGWSAGGRVSIPTGTFFWWGGRRRETLGDRLLAVDFFVWGLLGVAFLLFEPQMQAWHIKLHPVSALPAAFAAMLMVMALYEE